MTSTEGGLRGAWRRIAIGVVALAAALGIAACGGDDSVGGGESTVPTAEGGTPSGKFTISNWPGYIDPGKNGSIPEFEKETGVDVTYTEDVNDNVSFFNKVRPLLDQGNAGGRSMFVVTDWMARRMNDLGYLQQIDPADITTVTDNIAPQFETTGTDRSYAVPWQGGMTGIWIIKGQADDVKSINDLFDPKYKGKVEVLSEMRDTIPLMLKADGIDVANATKEDWLDEIDRLGEAVESGQIRRVTGNEYTEDVTSGNVVTAMGWSGDASLIGRKDVEWRMPSEGCTFWFDNMVIPVGAPNTAAALAFMNFVYRPEVQKDITDWVNYVTPVGGVQEILKKEDPPVGNSPLIFPTQDFLAPCDPSADPPGDAADIADVEAAFQEVISG